jgi:hypothetical protein
MGSNKNRTLRFAAGSPSVYHSAIWRLWVQGDDVYLGARGVLHLLKLSMHKSGIWRLAWTQESGIRRPHLSDRVEERWLRPPEFCPGWVKGPVLIVPDTDRRSRFAHLAANDPKIYWTPPPRRGHKVEFTVLFAAASAAEESWHHVFRRGDLVLCRFSLRDGSRVALSHRESPISPSEIAQVRHYLADLKIHYPKRIPRAVAASVFSAGLDSMAAPYILDLALGWENVVADGL